jgi:hypothetical protein
MWSDEHGMHMSTSTKAATKADEARGLLQELADEVFDGKDLLSYTEIQDGIFKARGWVAKTAEKKINGMTRFDIIRKAGGGKYALSLRLPSNPP